MEPEVAAESEANGDLRLPRAHRRPGKEPQSVSTANERREGARSSRPPTWRASTVRSVVGPPLLRDADRYAQLVGNLKDLELDDRTVARSSISEAFRRLYRAVAVDIDGTLTVDDDIELDPEVAAALKTILGRGIPVILVTGRGDESALAAMTALQSRRRDQSPGRLHCLIRNGAAVLEPVTGGTGQRHSTRALGPALDPDVWDSVRSLADAPDVVHPAAAPSDEPARAIRLEYMTEERRDVAYEALTTSFGGTDIYVTTARYRDIHTINITRITKKAALEVLAKELGLEPDEVLRIGDQGGVGGNDADLLDSDVGFSVGVTSRHPGHCHPVIDETEAVIGGAHATVVLLEGVTLSPPIKRIDVTVDNDALRRFGSVEKRARAGAEVQVNKVTAEMARSFAALLDDGGGLTGPPVVRLADIFDPMSGAVRLRDYELLDLNLPADHPAARLFALDTVFDVPPGSGLAMASDSGVLLRGAYYYMGHISEPAAGRVYEFFATTTSVMTQGIETLHVFAREAPDLTRLKLVLGIADHVRNALLQTLHLVWMSESRDERYVLLPEAMKLASRHTAAHLRLLLRNDELWADAISHYAEELALILDALEGLAESDLADLDETQFAKALIRDRECDHFLMNVAAVGLGLDGHRARMALRRGANVTCYGLPGGGLELPLIAQALGDELDLRISPALLHASTYEDEVTGNDLRSRKTRSIDELKNQSFPCWIADGASHETVLIADDNTTTGVTLQLAIDILAVEGVETAGAIMVQYPSLNRREHMRIEGHGCVDPEALLGFVRGLIQPTPYTRLLQAGEGKDRYRDFNKVFNKSKTRIETMLKKAGLKAVPEDTAVKSADSGSRRWWQRKTTP
ncbi:MAG: haloacid dehalogenase [Aeromicrobium sp.]|nr:haloacid dehalogenase [Aeromicrobium sp.]